MRGGRRGWGDLGMALSLLACFLCVLSFVDCQLLHPRGFEAARISQKNVDDASTAGLAPQMSTSPALLWRGSASLSSPGVIVCSFGFVLLGFVMGLTAQRRFLLLRPKSPANEQSWKGERTLQPLAQCRSGDGGDGAVSSAGVEGEGCAYEDGGAGKHPSGDARGADGEPGPERGAIAPCLDDGTGGMGSDSQGPVGGCDDDVREDCDVGGSSMSQVGVGGASEVCSTRGGRGNSDVDVGRSWSGEKDESTSLALSSSEPVSHVSRAVVAACSVRCDDEVIEDIRTVGGSLPSVAALSGEAEVVNGCGYQVGRIDPGASISAGMLLMAQVNPSFTCNEKLSPVLASRFSTLHRKWSSLENHILLDMKAAHHVDAMLKLAYERTRLSWASIRIKKERIITKMTESHYETLEKQFSSVLFFGIMLMLVSGGMQIWRVGLPKTVAPNCGSCVVVPPPKFLWMFEFLNSLWLCASVVSCYLKGLGRVSLSVLVLLTVPLLMTKAGVFNNFEHMVVLKLFVFGASCGGAGRIAVSGLGGSGSLWLWIWALWMALEAVLFSAAHELSRYQARREVTVGVSEGVGGGEGLETRRQSLRSLKLLIWVVVGVVVPMSAGVLPFMLHS